MNEIIQILILINNIMIYSLLYIVINYNIYILLYIQIYSCDNKHTRKYKNYVILTLN